MKQNIRHKTFLRALIYSSDVLVTVTAQVQFICPACGLIHYFFCYVILPDALLLRPQCSVMHTDGIVQRGGGWKGSHFKLDLFPPLLYSASCNATIYCFYATLPALNAKILYNVCASVQSFTAVCVTQQSTYVRYVQQRGRNGILWTIMYVGTFGCSS